MNQTMEVMEIVLLGFQDVFTLNSILFILFLVIYILTLAGNLLIIILVAKFQSLQSPMYIFLTQLSVCDILLSTNISPKMLHVIISGGGTISLTGCITQFYFFCVSEGAESFLLTVMSYDRYLAICHPLHYTSIMGFKLCFQLILFSWLLSSIITLILTLLLSSLPFCSHLIDHYFCDFTPILKLSCTKHTVPELVGFVLAIPLATIPLFFIIFTYVSIFISILGISSSIGRQKAFSTCSSHLTVVCVFYGALITVYIVPSKGESCYINKVASLLYTLFNPFLNPIIYSFRNEIIKINLKKVVFNKFCFLPIRFR